MSSVAEAAAIVVLLLVLYVAVEYSDLRARYDDVFAWYAHVTAAMPHAPVNIGPTRAVLCYERPAWASVLLSRPISQQAAEFLIRLVRVKKVGSLYLFFGPGATDDGIARLNRFIGKKELWDSADNPLSEAGGGHIPYTSQLVERYIDRKADTEGDFSLLILWLYGYEEYIRQRFTQSATSVLAEWNFMFAATSPPPSGAKDSSCAPGSLISSILSAGVGAAGVGAMVGAPTGVGAPFGAAIGFVAGGLGALFGHSKCL